jgi:hypothetical protein
MIEHEIGVPYSLVDRLHISVYNSSSFSGDDGASGFTSSMSLASGDTATGSSGLTSFCFPARDPLDWCILEVSLLPL